MQNFDIKRNARRCCQTDEPFRPGDCFYSELVETEDGQLLRKDYAADQWSGMGDNAIGWWKQTVPQLESGKIFWAPDEVLLSYFQSLMKVPQQAEAAFVMALLMVQKRLLKLEDSVLEDQPKLVLREKKSGEIYEVIQQEIAPERIKQLEEQLCENLFSDQPFVEDDAQH
jgi:hypothetical protein